MPAMDLDGSPELAALKLERSISSPIPIDGPARIALPDVPFDKPIPIPKLNHEAIKEKARKRKKNKKKGMLPPAPAVNVVRGFQTPTASCGEDSDASLSIVGTPRLRASRLRDLPSATSSPGMKPASTTSVLSLKARLDALALEQDRRPSFARLLSNLTDSCDATGLSTANGSDGYRSEMETYDVTLEEDFVSPDARRVAQQDAGMYTPTIAARTIGGGLVNASLCRKMQADDFEKLRCLGKGAFGTVHLVKQHASGRLYAQKQFKKASLTVHKRLVEQTRTERSILESVNRHPFVVKLFYAFQDQERLYLILEYAQGGELFHHLAMERMFSEEVAAFYMAEIVLALEHLHRNVRVIYRDLKPENCLLDAEGHLLLTDFGLSKVAVDDDDRADSILGTIEYMAPEVIRGEAYDFTVDWWGLGAIGFDLLTGSPPFGGGNHSKIQQNILKQKLQLPYFLGPDAKDLLTRLLRKEPHKRLGGNSTKDLKVLKSHRFFRKIDWIKLEKRALEPPIRPIITDPELAENFDSEFTNAPPSPVDTRHSATFDKIGFQGGPMAMETDPFGGFSFVASNSLLESEDWMLEA